MQSFTDAHAVEARVVASTSFTQAVEKLGGHSLSSFPPREYPPPGNGPWPLFIASSRGHPIKLADHS
jgi:hypothetical protein